MKLLLLSFLSFLCIGKLFSQTDAVGGIEPVQLWGVGHTISDKGEQNFLTLNAEALERLQERIKALVAGFSATLPVAEYYKDQLAKHLGYPTFKEAHQKLSEKWIETPVSGALFSKSLSMVRLGKKVYFLNEGTDTAVLVFEEGKNGKMVFAEQYDSSAMDRTEAAADTRSRLKYERSRRAGSDRGAMINGLKWATRNVGTPDTFAVRPESPGMHYRFNSSEGWNEYSGSWYHSASAARNWEQSNDPCPAGWRIPTREELKTLLDTTRVAQKWTDRKGMKGIQFTDKATGESIFLPLSGYRDAADGRLKKGDAWYWSSEQSRPEPTDCTDSPACTTFYYLRTLVPKGVYLSKISAGAALNVRCVAD